jgi:hypothetical protein
MERGRKIRKTKGTDEDSEGKKELAQIFAGVFIFL